MWYKLYTHVSWFHLHDLSKVLKFIEAGSRLWLSGAEERGNGRCC